MLQEIAVAQKPNVGLHMHRPEAVAVESLPEFHPVAKLNAIYTELKDMAQGNHLPSFNEIRYRSPKRLFEYSLVLLPTVGDPYLDFTILHRGEKLPGIAPSESAEWQVYSDTIQVDYLEDRLMELASCLALRNPMISSALSARSSTLNLKVFRGLFPVYLEEQQCSAVILLVAPVYSEVL